MFGDLSLTLFLQTVPARCCFFARGLGRETVVFLLQDVREMLGKGYSKGEIAEVFAAEGCEISRHFWRVYRSMEGTQNDDTTAQNKATAMAHENDETGDEIGPNDAEIRGQNCTESTSKADSDVACNAQESGTSPAQEADTNVNPVDTPIDIDTDTGHDSTLEAGQKNPFTKILKGRMVSIALCDYLTQHKGQ